MADRAKRGSKPKSTFRVIKQVIGALAGAGFSLGFGIYMLVEPVSPFTEAEMASGSRRSQSMKETLDAIWGTPAGIVLILIGLACLGWLVKQCFSGSAEDSASKA